MSWRDRRMAAFSQAGLVEKFVDALVWVFYPVFLYQQGLGLDAIGWVVGIYGFVWGGSQFVTGRLSDHVGRLKPIVWGIWLCGGGVALTLLGSGVTWWPFAAAVTGFGMALLYPNLSAAVADISHPNWRSSTIGIYRFWRDLGYGIEMEDGLHFHIDAPDPIACEECGAESEFVRFGKRDVAYRDLPVR